MLLQNLFKYVRSFSGPLVAFLAAISVTVAPDGGFLFKLPPLHQLSAHADLYAAGLWLAVEWALRSAPSERNRSTLTALSKLLDAIKPNRACGSGHYKTESTVVYGPAS